MIREYQSGDFNRMQLLAEDLNALQNAGIEAEDLDTLKDQPGQLWVLESFEGDMYAIIGILDFGSHSEVFSFRSWHYKKFNMEYAKNCKDLLSLHRDKFVISIVDDTDELAKWAEFLGFVAAQRRGGKVMFVYGGGGNGC